MSASDPITLFLDIGSGTQDVLLHIPGREIENCPKFVLPAPARLVAARILAEPAHRPVHLTGVNMGGGFFRAVKARLDAGGRVSATPEAALALGDDPEPLRRMGLEITSAAPAQAAVFELADYDPAWWDRLLADAEVPRPERVAACAQDHGYHPGSSNRIGRFRIWERLLRDSGGHPEALIYHTVPPELTRLAALQQSIGGGPVADTGSAAVLGALYDPEIAALSRERGVAVVNVGNSHTIAFLVFQDRIWGVFEHHTGMLADEALWETLARFRRGALPYAEVFDSGGHGALTLDLPEAAQGFAETALLGPQRGRLAGRGARQPAPGGDMMLAGCFGLLHGLSLVEQAPDKA
ncbi:MAG: DUF1786 domain-containing protein [Desulfovibrionaceae bacterium]